MRLPLISHPVIRPIAARAVVVREIWEGAPPWALPVGLQAVAVVLWLLALPMIDLERMNDFGLVSQLPIITFVAFALMAVAFVISLRAPALRAAVLISNLVLLVVMLYSITVPIEDAPRFSITYIHAGFIEAIERTGQRFPNLDARFDWPVFFILASYLEQVTGLESLAVSPWIPALSNLVYLGPLWLIYRSLSPDRRLAWLAMFVFLGANWIGQDYLSPQGFNFLLYLVVLAVLLCWFRPSDSRPAWIDRLWTGAVRRLPRAIPVRRRWRLDVAPPANWPGAAGVSRPGLVVGVVLVFAVVVSSHQLTPFVLVMGVGLLVVLGRASLRGLPLLMGVMVGAWLSYMTVTFLAGHLAGLLEDLGQTGAVTDASVGRRLRGSEGHLAIVYFRLLMTLTVWLVAAVGVVRRLWYGKLDVATVMLAGVPFGLLALQSYGGEMLLRVYFFSLPFIAFLVAAAFRPRRGRMSARASVLLAACLVALVIALPVARYGNERADRMSRLELTAVEQLYEIAQPGSLLVTGNYNSPLRHQATELYRYRSIGPLIYSHDLDGIIRWMIFTQAPDSYLLLTRSMQATAEMFGGLPPGEWQAIVTGLRARDDLEVVLDNRDAIVFRLTGEAS